VKGFQAILNNEADRSPLAFNLRCIRDP